MTTAPTPTPFYYAPGSIKQDPVTLAMALRTNLPDPGKDWQVMTLTTGAYYCDYDDVQSWPDAFVAPSAMLIGTGTLSATVSHIP